MTAPAALAAPRRRCGCGLDICSHDPAAVAAGLAELTAYLSAARSPATPAHAACTVGGPPPGARWARTRCARPTVALTGVDRHNAALLWWRAQTSARWVHVYQHGGRWHVLVTDGLGATVADPTPDGLGDLPGARRVAAAAMGLLA